VESYSREFALFIDGIRIERGITRVDFIDEIVSLSQYKRYLKGAAPIPNNIVIQLADRLKYNITDLYSIYTRKYSKEDHELKDIYKLIQNYKYQEAYEKLMVINQELLISNYYKDLYDYCLLFVQHRLGKVSDVHVLNLYSQIIDYANFFNKDSFNLVEISAINQIVVISSKMENYEPADRLYQLLTASNFNYAKSDDNSIISLIYYNLGRVIFRQEDYQRTKELCKIGIDFAIKHENSNGLPHLLLLQSLAYKNLGDIESAYETITKCFFQLIILNNSELNSIFINTYNQNFEKPIEALLGDFYSFLK
jgi:tetratricopeptide (TPR) repeat protein